MPDPTPVAIRDQVIAQATSLPDLISKAETFDPALAAQLKGKALLASKTVWGTLGTMVISWAVTRYGLGWTPDTAAEVSGLLVMAATTALRAVTGTPITGVVSAAAVPGASVPLPAPPSAAMQQAMINATSATTTAQQAAMNMEMPAGNGMSFRASILPPAAP